MLHVSSMELFLAADNLEAARQPRIINKSWISEDVLAMVQGGYPGQLTCKGSRSDDIQVTRPSPDRSQLSDPTCRDLEYSLAIPTT
jgi:hypothetical protein